MGFCASSSVQLKGGCFLLQGPWFPIRAHRFPLHRGESPGAFPKAGPIFQQPFSLPESAQTLAGIALRAAGESVQNFPAASKFAGKLFQQRISDSHSLLEFSDYKLSVPLTGALFDCLIVGHSPGFTCIGPWGASKNTGLGRT